MVVRKKIKPPSSDPPPSHPARQVGLENELVENGLENGEVGG